jgi:hypothetical protein
MTDFGFVRADRLDIFLIKDDAVRCGAKVEHALLGSRYTLENSQNQTSGPEADLACRPTRLSAGFWTVLNEYSEVVHPFSEFHWE